MYFDVNLLFIAISLCNKLNNVLLVLISSVACPC